MNINLQYAIGIIMPFVGTTLGAACVFFLKDKMSSKLHKALLGFASGIMVAAAVWSLLIPALESVKEMGKWSVFPVVIGFMGGLAFLFFLERITPHLHSEEQNPHGPKTSLTNTTMLILAVSLHNIPEGMAVGVIFAASMATESTITIASAFALAIGVAIQNFPEGAIISLPLRGERNSRRKSFLYGMLSGIVEPIAALLTIGMASVVTALLPYLLSFAAGAMIYVVVEELLPEATSDNDAAICTWCFGCGFMIMMVLDVVLG
ncbi:MAG: ZIP family metal transporter [Lachnospiraceae bacterium]